MANYRQIHVSIWKDEWFLGLEPEKKLLFVYLFSNSETTIAGLYKIAFPVICFETGLSGEYVKAALSEFEEEDKIMYGSGVMWIKNMRKFHSSNSPKVLTRIRTDLENIPYCEVKISYLYHIDTGSQEKEKEKEYKKEEEGLPLPPIFDDALQIFAKVTGMTAFMAGSITDDIRRIQAVFDEHGQGTVDFMQPYYDAWLERGYRKTNTSWMDWAIAEEIPKRKQKEVDSELEKYR